MLNIADKSDSTAGSTGELTASEYNDHKNEIQNAVEKSGQTLTSSITDQFSKALFSNGVGASSVQDSGSGDAILLSPITGTSGLSVPDSYSQINGAMLRFKKTSPNTSASVIVNFGQSGTELGAKALIRSDGSPVQIGEVIGDLLIQWSQASDKWLLLEKGSAIKYVNTISELRTVEGEFHNQKINVLGYYSVRDVNMPRYYWDSASSDSDNGGSIIKPTSTSGAGRWILPSISSINIKWFGAHGDGLTEDTAIIQNAIDFVDSIGGGEILFPVGTYLIDVGGVEDSRDYGILLKSNTTLRGESKNKSKIFANANSDMDLIITARSAADNNIEIKNLTIDGNQANQSDGKFNLWLHSTDNVVIENVESINSGSWGFRIQKCDSVFMSDIKTDHPADLNADGIHFVDCNNVNCVNIDILTLGDDGFIIEALEEDISNYNVSNINITCPVTTAGGGRGLLLLLDESVAVGQHKITDINISNANIYNCKSSAVVLQAAQYERINIQWNDFNCLNSLNIVVGTATKTGYVKDCFFRLNSDSPNEIGVIQTIVDGTIENNYINARMVHDSDGFVGISLKGEYWKGEIDINHDPNGTKSTALNAIDMFASNSDLKVNINGGNNGINLRASANDNNFTINRIENQNTNSLNIDNAALRNKFFGGIVDGVINGSITVNLSKFYGIDGGENYGKTSISPDGSGDGVIPHGLKLAPQYANVILRGESTIIAKLTSVDSTNLNIKITDANGVPVTTGSYVVNWEARI